MTGGNDGMNIIAAVDSNWAIGYQNSLLVRIPRDQQIFREMTEGKVIVVGRRTLESFPQRQPLKKRVNIVLSRDQTYAVKGAVVVHSIKELMETLEQYDEKDVYVAGGSSSRTVTRLTSRRSTIHIRRMRIFQGLIRQRTGS